MTFSGPSLGAEELAGFARLLADRTRATFCLALVDGRSWTAGELARHAGVAPSTATAHISVLVDAGLLIEERRGRCRYLRLAGWQSAQLIEDLAAYAPPASMRIKSLRAATIASTMARARTCYDHLAGRLGVLLTDVMIQRGYLDHSSGFSITPEGIEWLERLCGPLAGQSETRRPLARICLDWTERRPHLAGVAGASLCREFLTRRWVVRIGAQRAVQITAEGDAALRSWFGMGDPELAVLHDRERRESA